MIQDKKGFSDIFQLILGNIEHRGQNKVGILFTFTFQMNESLSCWLKVAHQNRLKFIALSTKSYDEINNKLIQIDLMDFWN